MRTSWQTRFLDLISGKQQDVLSKCMRALLRVSSWGFRLIVSCRNWAFKRGVFKTHTSSVPLVISIGNIVTGGTGKTPTTLLLAEALSENATVAILSRGYRSQAESLPSPVILCQGRGPEFKAEYCGDEPYLLAKRIPQAHIIVGKDRRAASRLAERAGAHVLLLDDGMQHRRLARHFDLVVVDALNPFGHGYLLPRGLLRESPHALERANLIVLTHIGSHAHFRDACAQLAPYTSAPMVGTRLELEKIWQGQTQLKELSGRRIGLFCGIAHPERFLETVQRLGANVVAHHFYPDHCNFELSSLKDFADECASKGAELLVCTEKDYVKLEGIFCHALPLVWLQMRMIVVENQENWMNFIKNAKVKVVNNFLHSENGFKSRISE